MKEVHRKSQAAIGEYDEILTMVKVVLPRLEDFFFWFSKDDSPKLSEQSRKRKKS